MDVEKIIERIVNVAALGQLEHRSFVTGVGNMIYSLSEKLGVSPEEVGNMIKQAAEKRGVKIERPVDNAVALAKEKRAVLRQAKEKVVEEKEQAQPKRGRMSFQDLLAREGMPPLRNVAEEMLGRPLRWEEELKLNKKRKQFVEEGFRLASEQLKKEKGVVKGEELVARAAEIMGITREQAMRELRKRGREKQVMMLPAEQSGITSEEKIRAKFEKAFRKKGLPKGPRR